MGRTRQALGVAGLLTLAMLGAQPAYAAGTAAGSTIVNTASVSFQVGSITQTAVTASDTLTVDRRINLTVAQVGTTTTTVTPGQLSAVTTFTVTNTSNGALDLGLAVVQPVGGTAVHGGTDNFNANNVRTFVDTNSNGVFDAAADTLVTFLDEVAADATRTVFVVSDIPLGLTTGSVAGVTLTATGREAGAPGTQGAALVQTAGANTSAMDTVFADTAGATDAARDAAFSARDDYTVFTAALSVLKTSSVISDPLNGTTNPKMIPGATVQYCIAVSNAAGGADASTINVNDPLPAQVTYDSVFGIRLNGTVASGVCQADGTAGGSFASNTVTGTIASLPAGNTRTVVFRAVIN